MRPETRRLAVVVAFAAIYLIWGSTYLAIRIGLETLPPFLMAGTRFASAGALLYVWLRLRGIPRPTDRQWWEAALTGTLMLACGVGGVTWAEQTVPSGVAALLASTIPLWMTVLDTVVLRRSRGGLGLAIGLAFGLAGVAVLIGPSRHDLAAADPVEAAVILAGTLAWSLGSLRSRRADLPSHPAMTVAVQMIAGGVVLLALSSVLREWQDGFALGDVSLRSAAALTYLTVVGSMVALCCYVWLLRTVPAPAVATYAFVNPVVAVLLGWGIAGEAMGGRVVVAAALIVAGVAWIQVVHWLGASSAGRTTIPLRKPQRLPGTFRALDSAATQRTEPCREVQCASGP